MKKRQGLTTEQKKRVVELRNKRNGYGSIANKVGAKKDQVVGFLKTKQALSMGLQMSQRPRPGAGAKRGLTVEQKKKSLELRAEGLGFQRIADELGLKRDQVRDFTRTKAGQRMALFMDLDLDLISRENKKDAKAWECRECAITYLRKDSDINSTTYCSDRCKKDYWNRRRRETRKKKEYVCRHCERTFVRNGSQTYCSDACKYEEKECVVCQQSFRALRKDKRKVCNKKCQGNLLKRTHEEYYKDFSRLHKGSIVPLTMYDGTEEDITVWCVKCQKETVGKAGRFIIKGRPKRCDYCAPINSLGEKAVERWLTSNGISFIAEHTFADLVDVSPLRYDFAILNDDDTIRCLIEYDGRHHFEPVETFGGAEYFHEVQRSDAIKNQYAKDNGIDLHRISYKQKNELKTLLENILT